MRVSEPINSAPCRFCWGDHPDERCNLNNPEVLDPTSAAALEMFRRRRFQKCREVYNGIDEADWSDWDFYNLACVDCEHHDMCFKTPLWFNHLTDIKEMDDE